MGSGFWAVTRYDDVCAVDKDAETFTSTKFVNLEEVDEDLMDVRRSILETDGPRHRALRKLIQREFSAGNLMRNYEEFLRGLTRQTVDEALQSTEFDFVEEDLRRFPDPGVGPAARRAVQRHRPADRLGQPDGRQHRPGLHGLT